MAWAYWCHCWTPFWTHPKKGNQQKTLLGICSSNPTFFFIRICSTEKSGFITSPRFPPGKLRENHPVLWRCVTDHGRPWLLLCLLTRSFTTFESVRKSKWTTMISYDLTWWKTIHWFLPKNHSMFFPVFFDFPWPNNQNPVLSEWGVLREQLSQCLNEDAAAAYEARLSQERKHVGCQGLQVCSPAFRKKRKNLAGQSPLLATTCDLSFAKEMVCKLDQNYSVNGRRCSMNV